MWYECKACKEVFFSIREHYKRKFCKACVIRLNQETWKKVKKRKKLTTWKKILERTRKDIKEWKNKTYGAG
jgi:gas vesicle protein